MAVVGISKADDRPIKFEKLPAAAQQFVKTNFADNTVVFVTKDDDLIAPDFEVVLDNIPLPRTIDCFHSHSQGCI